MKELDAPWPSLYAAILWGILGRMNPATGDRDIGQDALRRALARVIEERGVAAVADGIDEVMDAATYRRPHERRARARAALERLFDDDLVDGLFAE